MRTLKKNKQTIYYANQIDSVPIYELDNDGNKILDYTDSEGNEYYRETGEYEPLYGSVSEVFGNIAMSGDESKDSEYGIDRSDYDAVLILDKGDADISETSIIWYESDVKYKDEKRTVPDRDSADFKILKPTPSLNGIKYLLGKLV